jgi:signal transduction histidine kinase
VTLERVLALLRWLIIGLALAIQLYGASSGGNANVTGIARALLFTGMVAAYNTILLVLRYRWNERQGRIYLAFGDAVCVAILNGLAGGIYSPFVFLLYLLIVEAALLFTPSGLTTYTAVTAIFYTTTALLLSGQPWTELNITIALSVVLGMFIFASVCGAITKVLEQERALVRREQELTAELNRQVVALSSLNNLTERLNASLDIDELMQSTVKELPDALRVDACVALLATQTEDEWELGSVWYGIDEDFEPLEVETLPQQVQVGPLVLNRADLYRVLETQAVIRLADEPNGAALLVVPLSSDDEHGGALALLRQKGAPFTQSDQEILAALARQLGLLTRNARLYEMERRNVARLQELEQMKSDFLSTISHELRTPLTSIKASSILMLSQPTDDTTGKLLRNIERNTERLNGLVSDLLDMARLQNGRVRLSPQPINLSEVATDVIATLRPLTDSKEQIIELQVEPDLPYASADKRRLEQILTNLLSNAYRYTPKGGHICLKLARHDAGGKLQISLHDTGPGIPLHEQELIFERFYRSPASQTTVKGGTGLGLSIARSLVELHGGKIWVESEPGTGANFYFTLPTAEEAVAKIYKPTAA